MFSLCIWMLVVVFASLTKDIIFWAKVAPVEVYTNLYWLYWGAICNIALIGLSFTMLLRIVWMATKGEKEDIKHRMEYLEEQVKKYEAQSKSEPASPPPAVRRAGSQDG
ncbi:hypothetical protein KAW65_03145 [candidate division WOR-3 bacterium]|nr:hypothetical protein [candidate division WOR-3 bacterium]